jgi:hypothetical protein
MNYGVESPHGCTEEFAELCALATTGELTREEQTALDVHRAECPACAELAKEYASLAGVAMAKLTAEFAPAEQGTVSILQMQSEQRLLAALHGESATAPPAENASAPIKHSSKRAIRPFALPLAAAALLLLSVGGAFELGKRASAPAKVAQNPPHSAAAPFSNQEKATLEARLADAQKSLATIKAQSEAVQKQLKDLTEAKAALTAQLADLTQKDSSDAASLASITAQRDSLSQQLADTSAALTRAKDDLNRAQQDRQGAYYRVATLETEVNDLNKELAADSNSAARDDQYLAADRDIRELMGARELYIADVFDVEHTGERAKPFGRVFYTKGKSLIFYAFDLDREPHVREASAFQAWGKPDSASAQPISLGIFYMDNEQNRRWVLKSADPNVLAQINAVFVTVEPKGGSVKPTGKPFLEAYLHSLPPNHP